MKDVPVIIVGAGPSGLATAASLAMLSIPSLILERDDCIVPLWRKRTYDRLHLHLAKKFCELPHFPFPSKAPTFVPKNDFLQYLDDYAKKFDVKAELHREVRSAYFDEEAGKWRVSVTNLEKQEPEEYSAKYLVVASGENDVVRVPEFPGMESFQGDVMHSSRYTSGLEFKGKDVLVVGSGNSGMEIAHDLCSSGANTSIVIRSPFHAVTREIWLMGMFLLNYLPLQLVDSLVLFLCYLKFGDTSKFGIQRPSKGPFCLKKNSPVYPVVDTGTVQKIKTGEIQVLPSLTCIKGNYVMFSNGQSHHFDAIILATGFRSVVNRWLKTDYDLIDDYGMCNRKFPDHWKGKNGLYCVGLMRRGLYRISEDALSTANDIKNVLKM